MNIPTQLKILGRVIKVSIVSMPSEYMGEYSPEDMTIKLSSAITDLPILEETFMHEIVHAINDVVGYELKLQETLYEVADSGELNGDEAFNLEEEKTDMFSKVLYATIVENKLF